MKETFDKYEGLSKSELKEAQLEDIQNEALDFRKKYYLAAVNVILTIIFMFIIANQPITTLYLILAIVIGSIVSLVWLVYSIRCYNFMKLKIKEYGIMCSFFDQNNI
jgi:xanthine/uracil permease